MYDCLYEFVGHDCMVLRKTRMNKILKVVVGSQAHGLATPESDWDYRGVFITPTSEILKLGNTKQQTSWIEGKDDDTSWELGHFLHLATKCNPTILETFLAPVETTTELGDGLRELFPHIWNSQGVMDAFIGYGRNQRKKFLEEKDNRPNKFAAAYLRSLVNAQELLRTGTFTVKISEHPMGPTIRRFKEGNYSFGEVIDTCRSWEAKVRAAYMANPNKQTDTSKINKFLLKARKENW